jgi:nitrate/nitrite transporter NarK
VAALVPAILVHDLYVGLAGFALTLFFMALAGAPLWTTTMDIAPAYAGSASALMNASGAVTGILSPVAFAWILDLTGNWTMSFALSTGLLLFAIVVTYWIRPDRRVETAARVGGLAVAGG